MFSDENRSVIVFNGEIYNYRLLRDELVQLGHRFRSNSDTEVLLNAYHQWGVDFLDKLRGMFALAIYDTQQKLLLLARDPFGIKPLYYATGPDTFLFASQVKALLASKMVDTRQSPAGQVGFFLWGHVPEPYTIFADIQSLSPGSFLVMHRNATPVITRYSRPVECLASLDRIPDSVDLVSLRQDLSNSVHAHLEADVPVGAFLSGGIDSTAICSLANAYTDSTKLRTFCIGFDEYKGGKGDETPIAAFTATHLDTLHHERYISSGVFRETVGDFLEIMDQPTVDGLNIYLVSRLAHSRGLKVALSGIGGDEFFGGYPSFFQVPHITKWTSLIPQTIGSWIRHVGQLLPNRLLSTKAMSLAEFGGSIEGAYFLCRGLFLPWELPRFLDSETIQQGLEQLDVFGTLRNITARMPNPYCAVMALEIECYMQNRLLRDTDWASMAHSLEVRTPFVDVHLFKRIAKHALSTKPITKTDLATCAISPHARAQLIPRKQGFNVPINEWLRTESSPAYPNSKIRDWAIIVARHHGLVQEN